jgi:hypothetical protein
MSDQARSTSHGTTGHWMLISRSPPVLDWEASLGSDHCGICSTWYCESPAKGDKRPFLSVFKPGCDEATTKEWCHTLATMLPPITPISTVTDLHAAARNLQTAFDTACEKHFQHKRMPKAHGHRWWNSGCTEAVDALKQASLGGDEEAIKLANARLRKITKTAKREWADKIIEEGQVWEVAKWRHGRKTSQITAMRTSPSQLTFDNNEISDILADRFFAKDPGPIQDSFPDDPPPRPMREWNPLTLKELGQYLDDTSDTSAPGNSGVAWWIIKLGMEGRRRTHPMGIERLTFPRCSPRPLEDGNGHGHTKAQPGRLLRR